jgi:uncharacterized repeat protein (TIGR03803 family)
MLHHRPESTATGGVFSADADDLVAPPLPIEVASVGRKSVFPAGAPDMEVARVAALKISGKPKNAPAPPVIAGTAAGQNTYDTASLKPFSAVTITDSNAGTQTETVTVSPSTTANGTLTDPNAGSDGSTFLNGTFTISGTASQVTAALDALVFTPFGSEVFTGTAVTTGFTIKVTDTAGGTATDSTTTVIATATAPFSDLASFNPAASVGTDPVGGVIADANGDLFGTTSYGAGQGVYELVKSGTGYAATPTVLLSLGPSTGYQSQAGLIADANGDLFGTAYYSGQYGYGTVFEIAKSGTGYATTPIILANFNGGSTGAYPLAGLSFDSSGDLFGTTQLGGSANGGAVFEIVKTANGYASTPTILLNFGSVAAGSNANQPDGGLFVDAAGNIFGTTLDGGTGNLGTLWELAKTSGGYAATPTILINFNGNNGGDPRAGLIADANGDLFGTTSFGGSGGEGTVFELVKTAGGYASAPTVLVNFAGANGYDPQAGLIADASGNLFGTTVRGGIYNDGTVFEVVKTAGGYASTPVILLSFDGADGANPVAGLTPSASGTLYGTTEIGGANNSGTIFAVDAGFAVAKPVIAGTVGGQTTSAEAPVQVFAGVTLTDANSFGGGIDTLTITYAGGGTLSGSSLLTGSAGSYTLTGTGAALTAALDALIYTPTAAGPGSQATTTFTLTDTDITFATQAADSTTTLTNTDPGVPPTITVSGTTTLATTSEAPVKVFANVTVTDINTGGSSTDTLTITLSGGGTLSGAGLVGSNGTYTLTGTASAITTALQALSFTPIDGVPNTSVTTGFTLSDKSSADATLAVNAAITVTDTDPAVAPSISVSGTTSFATISEATVKPFAGVTITDANNGGSDTDTLTITLSGNGTLTGTGLAGSGGTYTLTGTAAAIAAELQNLVFHPVDGVPDTSVTTGFTLSDKSSASSTAALYSALSVTDTDPAVAPTISTSGATSLTTTSEAALSPFAGVTVSDLNNGGSATDTLTIIQSGSGTLTGTGLAGSNGTYTLTGTAAAITAALEALVFHATDGVPNTSVTTSFALTDKSSASASSSGTTTLSVTDHDPAVAPSISATGTTSFATTAEAPVKPFGNVTITDTNSGGTDTLTITLSGAGTLTGTGLISSNGTYTLAGTAATVTGELQALVFTPSVGQANSSATTTFTLTDKSSASTTVATNSAITVTDTDPAAVSVISGAVAGQTTTDEQTLKPFATVTITDPNAGTQQDSMVITVSGGTADGTLSGTGLTYLGGGNYELSPVSPATLQAELEALVFTPTAHQVTPGSTVTTTFGLIVVNENSLVSSTNSTTTVIATAVNDSPTISGALAGQTLLDNATDKPFATVSITDPDLSVSDSVTITMKNSAGSVTDADGALSGAGLTKTGTGTYVLSAASPATLTAELAALVFTPTAHQVNAGATVATFFTLAASQTAGGSTVTTTNTSTSVTVTAIGIAPTISITGSTTIIDSFDAAVKPFAGVTIADLNDGGVDTDTFVITESGLAGALSGTGLTGANGTYTLTGSVATINSELQNLSFTPSASLLAANTVFGFSLTSSGYGTATVHSNAITVTSSSLLAVTGPDTSPASAELASAGAGTLVQAGSAILADFLATHADLPASHALFSGHSAAGFDSFGDERHFAANDGGQLLAIGALPPATPVGAAGLAMGHFPGHALITL